MAGEVPPLVSTGEAARRLGVSDSYIRKKCAEGKIPYIKTDGGHYRISEQWVDQEVEEKTRKIESFLKKREA